MTLCLGLICLQASVAAAQKLRKAELRELLSSNSLAGNGKDAIPAKPFDWVAHYGGDRKLVMRLKPAWGGLTFRGRWWLTDDNEFCRIFEKPQKKDGCWHMFRETNSLHFVPTRGVAVEGNAITLKGNQLEQMGSGK